MPVACGGWSSFYFPCRLFCADRQVACDLRPDFHDELAVKVELGNYAESVY